VTSNNNSKRLNPFSLDAINFLLADVRGALGPYLNVFLVTQRHWSQTQVGLVTTLRGLLGLAAQTPIGAAIDATRAKRGVVVLALAVLAIRAVTLFALPSFWPVAIANSLMAIVGGVFGPAVAALTLGLYARNQLARRMGRNAAFDHAGNVAIAAVAGAVGYAFSQRAVFLLVPVFAVLAGIAVLSIPAGIFGALTPLVVADIMQGTGRYNLALGAIATMQGVGASLSGLAAGEIVDHFGYSPAFLILGGAALVALVVFAFHMPETVERGSTEKALVSS
jgi:MFS family permease